MRSEYEEKIFEFYSEKENFSAMVDVANAFPAIATKMIQLFWEDVLKELRKRYSSEEWVVEFSDKNLGLRHIKLWVYRTTWRHEKGFPRLAVGFEGLHLDRHCWVGVFLANGMEGYNSVRLREDLRNIPSLIDYQQDSNDWWAKWENINPAITRKEGIKQLNSEDRDEAIKSVVEQAVKFVNILDDKALEILIDNKIKGQTTT